MTTRRRREGRKRRSKYSLDPQSAIMVWPEPGTTLSETIGMNAVWFLQAICPTVI